MATKERQVDYYTIYKNNWTDKKNPIVSFPEITDLLTYIMTKSVAERLHPLKQSKSCSLANIEEITDEDSITITGFFKSGVSNYRPNLMNVVTGTERENPKTIYEGEVEKTHFCIKICSSDVYIILEKNGNGVSINQVLDYLGSNNRQWLNSLSRKKNYSLNYAAVGREDFEGALRELNRAQVAEVYIEKSIVGSDALNYSQRLTSLKSNVVLSMRAEKSESIKETVMDVVSKMGIFGSRISKIRIFGKDSSDHSVMIDSGFLCKKSTIEVDLNPTTGEIMTTAILSELKQLSESIT